MTPRELGRVGFWGGTLLLAASACLTADAAGQRLETLWDEPIDLAIARGLRANPLRGESPTLDGSQTRGPMYLVAAAQVITGRADLSAARRVSAVVGGLTVLATAVFARQTFGAWAGLMGAALLAGSPYFLAFARVAMTEGDVCFAAAMLLAVWSYADFARRPTWPRWTRTGVLAGVALGCKPHAVVLWAVFAAGWPRRGARLSAAARGLRPSIRSRELATAPQRDASAGGLALLTDRLTLWLAAGVLAAGAGCVAGQVRGSVPTAAWVGVLATWVGAVGTGLCRRGFPEGRASGALGLAALSLLTCVSLMPVHLLAPRIAGALGSRILSWDGRVPLALWDDHLRLYAGLLLIKSTLPVGVACVAALLFAGWREAHEPRWRGPILAVVFTLIGLCFLPLRQTFYLMGVYPLVAVLCAGFLTTVDAGLRTRLQGRDRRVAVGAWRLAVVLMFTNLGREAYAAFPHYHLFGWQTVGERWMGAEARGYRNLVQTNSDGVEELVHWCRTNVPRGARVVSFLWEDHIIRPILGESPGFAFIGRGVTPASAELPPPPDIGDADYVLLHINNVLGYGDRPPDAPPAERLADDFDLVHRVTRAGMEVGWVYRQCDAAAIERRRRAQAPRRRTARPANAMPASVAGSGIGKYSMVSAGWKAGLAFWRESKRLALPPSTSLPRTAQPKLEAGLSSQLCTSAMRAVVPVHE